MKKSYLLGVMHTSVFLFMALLAGLLSFSSAIQASTISLPSSFTGIHGVDWPNDKPVYDMNDGDPSTTDYFYEWVVQSRDSSNNLVNTFSNSIEDWMPLVSFLFPEPGTYTVELVLTTSHQKDGRPECGPHSYCYDDSLASTDTSNAFMKVTLNAVPIPASVWLFSSGLLGLVSIARRVKRA